MNELGTIERNLLAALAEADEPSESDRERVRVLVLQRVTTAAGIAAATWAASTGVGGAAAGGAAGNVAAAASGSGAAVVAATGVAASGATAGGTVVTAATTSTAVIWKSAIAAKVVAVAIGAGLAGGAGWYAANASAPPAKGVTVPQTLQQPAATNVSRVQHGATPDIGAAVAAEVGQPEAAAAAPQPHAVSARADRTASERLINDRLGAEAALLKRAQQAINNGDNAAALALASEHATKYPNGVLVQERIGLQAITLCRTGAHDQGVAAATRFLKANPSSPLSDRVRSSCELTSH